MEYLNSVLLEGILSKLTIKKGEKEECFTVEGELTNDFVVIPVVIKRVSSFRVGNVKEGVVVRIVGCLKGELSKVYVLGEHLEIKGEHSEVEGK